MLQRVVVPEILDHLPPADPAARRSRRDLRWINFLMGNERWLRREVARFPEAARKGISELGAGDGALAGALVRRFPGCRVAAYDLAPPPGRLAENISWQQGDVFAGEPPTGGILVANLFLHHFTGGGLERLGEICGRHEVAIFCEPLRSRAAHAQGRLLHFLVNEVTRHDMHASIDAGFRPGELPVALRLAAGGWEIREHSSWRGALRTVAWRV